MPTISQMLEANEKWATEKKLQDPSYFECAAAEQTPEMLWVGCSDARVGPDKESMLSASSTTSTTAASSLWDSSSTR